MSDHQHAIAKLIQEAEYLEGRASDMNDDVDHELRKAETKRAAAAGLAKTAREHRDAAKVLEAAARLSASAEPATVL